MQTKKEFRWFSIFQYQKEQEYLRQQHKNGWRFLRVSGFGIYLFEKCAPEDVVYQLDYNQEGSKHKAEYIQMFSDCGWDYLQEYAGYSYFCKRAADMQGEEEIFCDDSSRLAMMERVFKGRLTPLLVIFSACLLPQFVLNLTSGHYGVAGMLGGVLLLYITMFILFAVQYGRFKKGLLD